MKSETCFYISIHEVSTSFGIEETLIQDIVDEGIVTAIQNEKQEWQLDARALGRIRTVLHLYHDLGVNLAGAALALELLDELHTLRQSVAHRRK
jgi:chaperone modulatory protein CbpM